MPPLEELDNDPAERRARDQPRPALGLRPWFALLRRARSLRRFALAIRPRRVTALRGNCPISLIARVGEGPEWRITLPRRLVERVAGIRSVADGRGVLLAGSAVHGWGMAAPLLVLALDRQGQVLAARCLVPGTMWRHRGAAWMLELPVATREPGVGAAVRLLVSPREQRRTHGRDTHLVRNPHREHG